MPALNTKQNMLCVTAAVAFPLMANAITAAAPKSEPAIGNYCAIQNYTAPAVKTELAQWPENMLAGDTAYLLEGLAHLKQVYNCQGGKTPPGETASMHLEKCKNDNAKCVDYQDTLDKITKDNPRPGNLKFTCMGIHNTPGMLPKLSKNIVRIARVQVTDTSDHDMDPFEILVTVAPEDSGEIMALLLDSIVQDVKVYDNLIQDGVAPLSCQNPQDLKNSSQYDLILGYAYGASFAKDMFDSLNSNQTPWDPESAKFTVATAGAKNVDLKSKVIFKNGDFGFLNKGKTPTTVTVTDDQGIKHTDEHVVSMSYTSNGVAHTWASGTADDFVKAAQLAGSPIDFVVESLPDDAHADGTSKTADDAKWGTDVGDFKKRKYFPELSKFTRTLLMNPVLSSMIRAEQPSQALVKLVVEQGEDFVLQLAPQLLELTFKGLEGLALSSGNVAVPAALTFFENKLVAWAKTKVQAVHEEDMASDGVAMEIVGKFADLITQAQKHAAGWKAQEGPFCTSKGIQGDIKKDPSAMKACGEAIKEQAFKDAQPAFDALQNEIQNEIDAGNLKKTAGDVLMAYLETLWYYMRSSKHQDTLFEKMYEPRMIQGLDTKDPAGSASVTLDLIVRMAQDAVSACTGTGYAINLDPVEIEFFQNEDDNYGHDVDDIFSEANQISTMRKYLYANKFDVDTNKPIYTLDNMSDQAFTYKTTESSCPDKKVEKDGKVVYKDGKPVMKKQYICDKSEMISKTKPTGGAMWGLPESCCVTVATNAEYIAISWLNEQAEDFCHDYRGDNCDIYDWTWDAKTETGSCHGEEIEKADYYTYVKKTTSATDPNAPWYKKTWSWVKSHAEAAWEWVKGEFHTAQFKTAYGLAKSSCWGKKQLCKTTKWMDESKLGRKAIQFYLNKCEGLESRLTDKVHSVTNQLCGGDADTTKDAIANSTGEWSNIMKVVGPLWKKIKNDSGHDWSDWAEEAKEWAIDGMTNYLTKQFAQKGASDLVETM